MPALVSTSLLEVLIARGTTPTNGTTPLQVVCAWPLSGQYGPFLRFTYYLYVAACIIARKREWLENALIVPAISALHGIALAALHVHDAVDMDIYGALQMCGIGILVAAVTAKLSRTYLHDYGRNILFLWTVLILSGMTALTVEFFRINITPCRYDDSGNPISSNSKNFPYGAMCNLTCSVEQGPYSPMRAGSANNIYVIPAPEKITFGLATLLMAACCIPALLSLVNMWSGILEINWKARFGNRDNDEPTEVTNAQLYHYIRVILKAVEIPTFAIAVLSLLILGEVNFFSPQVIYQNEPVAAIGQWGPLVGTIIIVSASLYIFLGKDRKDGKEGNKKPDASIPHCDCHCNTSKPKNGADQVAASSPTTRTSSENITTCGRGSSAESTEVSSIEMVSMDISLAADEYGLEELCTELCFNDAANGPVEGQEQQEQYKNADTGNT